MARFQLEAAYVLDVFALISALVFYLGRNKEGKIRLSDEAALEQDPFDVTTAEDLRNGDPIDEDVFWAAMKERKQLLLVLVGLLFGVQTAALVVGGFNALGFARFGFAFYVLVVAAFAVGRQTFFEHRASIWHLSLLSVAAIPILGFTALLPDYPYPISSNLLPESLPTILWGAAFALYIIIAFIASTTPCGPALHYPPSAIYSPKITEAITNKVYNNVSGVANSSPWSILYFSYSTKVVMLGNTAASLEIGDLPILTVDMRATHLFDLMRRALRTTTLRVPGFGWTPAPGAGLTLAYQLFLINRTSFLALFAMSFGIGGMFYVPPMLIRGILTYLEADPQRLNVRWGLTWVVGLLIVNMALFLLMGQVWGLAAATLQARIRTQLNSVLFAKTLVRKDIASAGTGAGAGSSGDAQAEKKDENKEQFSSKAQIMTLMTTDVDRVAKMTMHLFSIIDVPIEIVVGTTFLYRMLGVSAFFGLGVAVLCLPLNHFAGSAISRSQESLMKARDERVSLMNEVLGGIRMLKACLPPFCLAFEKRILSVRMKELKFQRLNYIIQALLAGFWNGIPVVITLVSFYHYAVIRGMELKPSIAFTSILVFNEIRFALDLLASTFINMIQSLVSMRRIEKYLDTREIALVPALSSQSREIAFTSCTVTWPQDRLGSASKTPTPAATPRHKFLLMDLSLEFPRGELSLVCGKLGSGKTLLLLGLLGEADVLTGQVFCPRSPANILASFAQPVGGGGFNPVTEDWLLDGVCAYVPQTAWLQNASIKDNILFTLPYDEERYRATLEACALESDLKILEDGDDSEIGERGINLSGGQRARVSLARAVYSRATVLLLDDVLSAVDAHTAHHLYHTCLRGPLMRNRTVVLVSHHVQLCAPDAKYVVALDNGKVQFAGDYGGFKRSGVMGGLVQNDAAEAEKEDAKEEAVIETKLAPKEPDADADAEPTKPEGEMTKKTPRKYIEEEQRAVGHVSWSVWQAYINAAGGAAYWTLFFVVFLSAALARIAESWWLSYWSRGAGDKSPLFYISIYAALAWTAVFLIVARFLTLYFGGIRASKELYQRLLEAVLFAQIRFHDTVSRGRVLNRFGKDFESIDSNLPDNIGRTVLHSISAVTTIIAVSFIGGLPFVGAVAVILYVYWRIGKIYGQSCRDLRRLDSVSRSPLYSMYSETIAGVAILRAFGASSKFMRDMLRHVDTNTNPSYWTWGTNRWLTMRLTMLATLITACMAMLCVLDKTIPAASAGFALAFCSTLLHDLILVVREFVNLEQSMVGLERVKEYSELQREPPEFVDPRPAALVDWPQRGVVKCEELVIRYAPDLPDVLHGLTFEIQAGEKIGILGRTGSGKSTLALSFFRFVEPTSGRILIDGQDITQIGLTDLRGRLTIIPQDPTILSGTLRSTLDVFGEYEDRDIFEALRRVHLIPSDSDSNTPAASSQDDAVNENVFRNLDAPVSEGGENFSTGEKQLLCMARAILKRSKVLLMDEATASVDYATDQLIGQTIREEFRDSTILTIAHRLRTVIDGDKVMVLDQGRIAEFDKPAKLLADPTSKFHALCKATGPKEFKMLKKMAGVSA
ncbi:Multidrug resistance-associated ABC transporter protein [Mycena chlorophos]|uniref:Multidrug resistance-associated ABC transporter protein n=1 Tax=Mycena chlorophos TaxID=658473 RepID=A0A8H6VWC0_MYCCL|nr:Multidrug resistance-associated ABC transporter protein [Mycena chlorophos]